MIKNVFNQNDVAEIIERINQLTPESQPQWGKMSVAQMLAHCNISYEYVFQPEKYKQTGAFVKFMLKLFVKKKVVNEEIYKQNSPTSPDFIIKNQNIRLTIDTQLDFDLCKTIYAYFCLNGREISAQNIVLYLNQNPMFIKQMLAQIEANGK